MRGLISWVLIGVMIVSGCASSTPPPLETDEDTSEPERLPEILSSFKPGDRIEIWTESGECFEAKFVAFTSSTLTVKEKTYELTYQRDNHFHRDQVQYVLRELARVRVAPPRVLSQGGKPDLGAVLGVFLTMVLIFGILFVHSGQSIGIR